MQVSTQARGYTSDTPLEFRTVVVCTQDPCTYCRAPARRRPQVLIFSTSEEAAAYGRHMAQNVYGASVHSVTVEERRVDPWMSVH